MDFFESLRKAQKGTPFDASEEMRFFLRNSGILMDVPSFAKYNNVSKPFDIVRANIIIRALQNKRQIEECYMRNLKNAKKEKWEDPLLSTIQSTASQIEPLPYYQEGNHRIFVPIFSRSINQIYDGDFSKLQDRNYKLLLSNFQPLCIDPFDLYGNDLFNSYFTKFILVQDEGKIKAYYDYDSATLYFVNQEGRLETEICLFDKWIRRKNENHMIERVIPVAKAYFDFNREGMIKALVDNQLISSTLISKILSKESALFRKMEKHSR